MPSTIHNRHNIIRDEWQAKRSSTWQLSDVGSRSSDSCPKGQIRPPPHGTKTVGPHRPGLMGDPAEPLPGTLDVLILKAVSLGTVHGYGVLLRRVLRCRCSRVPCIRRWGVWSTMVC
jgi:hypothetical protein